jgi:uncharacterized protein
MSQAASSQPLPLPDLAKAGPRIDALDLLRGIAILGIFLMNTWTMSLPQDTYTNPATYNPNWVQSMGFPYYNGPGAQPAYFEMEALKGLNHWVYVGIHLFADMKFITTFSILFGAGIVLQAERARKKGNNPWLTHYLRMSVLLVFGLVHTFGFWYGDILTDYALAGLILAPFRLLPPWLLFLLGMTMIAGTTAQVVAHDVHRREVAMAKSADEIAALDQGWYKPLDTLDDWQWGVNGLHARGIRAFKDRVRELGQDPSAFSHENDREVFAHRGNWWTQVVGHRFWTSVIDHTTGFISWTFWRCGGCMLLGMALQKRRFFHAAWPREACATIAALTIPIGWILSYRGVMFNQHEGWVENGAFLSVYELGSQFNYWGSLLCSFGYLSVGVLLAIAAANPLRAILHKCLIPIRSIGRMALTCYLAETLIGTTIFYGHGFGLFGKTERWQNLPIVLGTWVIIMIFATVWLTLFRQGPLEWFWHSIVYWDWKNPRLAAAGPDASLSPSVAGTVGQPRAE